MTLRLLGMLLALALFSHPSVAQIVEPPPKPTLINPLPIISHYESGNGTNTGCSATGACGIFQDVGATWRAALQGIGIDPSTYENASLAPPSVQIAANNWLINTRGLQPWTCAACDPAFTAYVNAHGGPAAFQLTGLDTNPADFTQYDTDPAALAAFLNSDGAGAGGDGGGGGGGGGDTLTQVTPGGPASPTALGFEWVFKQIMDATIGSIDTSIQEVELLASGPATAILALAIAVMGMMTLVGNMDMATFMAFALRAAIVMAFVQVGNTFYSDWVEKLVNGLPGYFQTAFSTTATAYGTPAQIFDQILNNFFASALTTWRSAGWSMHAYFDAIAIALMTVLIVLPTLAAMFTVFMISTFLLLIMLTIGPLMTLALLFQVTRRFFHAYVNTLVTGSIFALVVYIVLGIFENIMAGMIANFTPTSPTVDIPGLLGLCGSLLVMSFSMARLPRLIEGIGGGVSVSLDTIGRFMAGGAIADAAAISATAAKRVL